MSRRLKYSKNGIIVFDNVREHIENDDFPEIPIGRIGGIDGWYIQMEVDTEDNKIYPFIFCLHKPKLIVKVYTRIIKKDGVFSFRRERKMNLESYYGIVNFTLNIERVLNEKKAYLDGNGGLSIGYGIHVESIKGEDDIWKFNFYDTLFDCQNMKNMITFKHGERGVKFLHCHKQLLSFQTKLFDTKSDENKIIEIPSDIDYEALEQCLQIAHGVRLQVSQPHKWFSILDVARKLSLPNVIHYCEQKVIENYFVIGGIDCAINNNLNRWLAKVMKLLKSVKKLKKILKNVDVDEMSGEAMKQCAKFIFKNSK